VVSVRCLSLLLPYAILETAFLSVQAPLVAQQPYWQQEARYTLEAYLDEDAEELQGAGRLVYRNRSDHALEEIYFHLYLNAFRPNSIWAQVEERPEFDFQSLEEPEQAYSRLGAMRMEGAPLTAEYPFAPDSTVVRFPLPRPIQPEEAVAFTFEWRARPSTLCRRQCRRGRSYDFAQWYPRVAVFDRDGWQAHPLYPQGEFYGEYGSYDVTLDLPEDQVVGSTGVVLDGDPGWRPLPTSPVTEIRHQREWYPTRTDSEPVGMLTESVEPGRKRLRLYAENVHHFAWSTSPDYLYEGGTHGEVSVHVLLRSGDLDWDLGSAVGRSIRALDWLETVFGPYPYPQVTNLHRLEAGGTEFPMLIMNGGPSQALIVHELSHQWTMGILGSNEWRDAYLDEGLASFLSNWFMEEVGGLDPWPNTVRNLGQLEAAGGLTMPVATPSEEMPGFRVYQILAYTKPSVVFRMLREHLGTEVMRAGLALYSNRKAFQHVNENDLRQALEDVSGTDLGWFFEQWFHTTATLDYQIDQVSQAPSSEGWTTTVTVVREGDAWMPVTLQVGGERVLLEGREDSQSVQVKSLERPARVIVDPDRILIDTDWSNNVAVISP
jgi:hypothetical protein